MYISMSQSFNTKLWNMKLHGTYLYITIKSHLSLKYFTVYKIVVYFSNFCL